MEGKKLAQFLLLMIVLDLLVFSSTEGSPWWDSRRRRRRCRCSSSRPSGVSWVNIWQQHFSRKCPTSKEIDSF